MFFSVYRQWTLRLVPDGNLFSKDAVFESSQGLISFDTSHSYTGTILGKLFLLINKRKYIANGEQISQLVSNIIRYEQ